MHAHSRTHISVFRVSKRESDLFSMIIMGAGSYSSVLKRDNILLVWMVFVRFFFIFSFNIILILNIVCYKLSLLAIGFVLLLTIS